MTPVSALEKTAVLQILLFLHENKEALRTEIGKAVQSSTSTIGSSLVVLGELGLLEERREPPVKRYISLSPLGKQVAQNVWEINNLLKDT